MLIYCKSIVTELIALGTLHNIICVLKIVIYFLMSGKFFALSTGHGTCSAPCAVRAILYTDEVSVDKERVS